MSNCILISGGSGYIGSHTIIELFNKGFEVVSVDNQSNSSVNAYENVKKITGKEVKSYSVDLCNIDASRVIFKNHQVMMIEKLPYSLTQA